MFLLVIILYTGNVMTTPYDSAESCEAGLIQTTDLGNYKRMKEVKCINLEIQREVK